MSTALLYRVAHLGNVLRSPISIGSKIESYRPDENRMSRPVYTIDFIKQISGGRGKMPLLGKSRVIENEQKHF